MTGKFKRVSRQQPCRTCGKSDWCGLSTDGKVSVCMRVKSDRPSRNGGWLHSSDSPVASFAQTPSVHSSPKASRNHLDAIYSTLLRGHLVLANEHKAKLMSRGLTPEQIENFGYRSTPPHLYASNITAFLSRYDLAGVPGFYFDRIWRVVPMAKGIIIPVRDSKGRIQALQIRRDDDSDGRGKYLWFSSANRPGGCSSGAPVHCRNTDLIREQHTAMITEGALKADVIAARMNCAVLGLAGVSTFSSDFPRQIRQRFPELRQALVAFDSDFRTNDAVRRAVFRLVDELCGADLEPRVLVWNPEHKGLDDLIKAA